MIHTANVAGTVNSMGADVMSEEALEAELEELLLLDDEDGEHPQGHEAPPDWRERLDPVQGSGGGGGPTPVQGRQRLGVHRRGESISGSPPGGWVPAPLLAGGVAPPTEQRGARRPAAAAEDRAQSSVVGEPGTYARMAMLA